MEKPTIDNSETIKKPEILEWTKEDERRFKKLKIEKKELESNREGKTLEGIIRDSKINTEISSLETKKFLSEKYDYEEKFLKEELNKNAENSKKRKIEERKKMKNLYKKYGRDYKSESESDNFEVEIANIEDIKEDNLSEAEELNADEYNLQLLKEQKDELIKNGEYAGSPQIKEIEDMINNLENKDDIKQKNVKTAEEILESFGMTINMEDIKSDIKCSIDNESVKIKFENEKAIEELFNELNLEESKRESIKNNIEITLNSVLDAEAEREFSRLFKYHKKVLATGMGVGVVAGLCSAGVRLLGGGVIKDAGKTAVTIAGGATFGAISGAMRGKIRQWMNPSIEKIKNKNSKKLIEIREEKSEKIFNNNNLKTVAVQEIRRAVLDKLKQGDESIVGNKENALKFIENQQEFNGLEKDEQEKLANSIAVLTEVMDENSKNLEKIIKGKSKKEMSEVKRSALFGGAVGGAVGVAQTIGDNPYMPAIVGGAIGGIMVGHAIDASWAKKEIEKKGEKLVNDINKIDSSKEKTEEDLSKIKSYLESGVLDQHPLTREKAKNILMDEIFKNSIEINKEIVEQKNELLKKEFTRKNWKKAVSYIAGVGGSIITGVSGKFVFEHAKELMTTSSTDTGQNFELSEADEEVIENLENLSEKDKECIKEKGLLAYIAQKHVNDSLDSINNIDAKADHAGIVGKAGNKKILTDKPISGRVEIIEPKEIEKVYNPAEVEIKGDINTLSEAVSKALNSENTTVEVKDNFIHKWSGDNINIDENNRSELLNQAIKKMSVANMDNDTKNDVFNLIHKGDVVSINKDGKIELNAESGIEAEKVSELQLRENWADIEGAKHGFKPNEVSFGGGQDNLSERSYNVDVDGVEVNIDNNGNFKATVEDEEVYGNISDLKKEQTAKNFISEKINNVRKIINDVKIETEVTADFKSIVGNSGLTQEQAKEFGINFNDGLDNIEKDKIKFVVNQELINNPEKAKQIFDLSEKTGIGYDKPHFIKAYKLMPDDIKASKNIEKAEGFLQIFAGTKMQVGEGLGKLGISGETWTKNVHGTITVENAFEKEGVKVFLTEQKISCEKSRFISLFGTKKIFNEKLSLDNINELKNIFGIKMEKAINGISSNRGSIPGM